MGLIDQPEKVSSVLLTISYDRASEENEAITLMYYSVKMNQSAAV